MQGRTPVGDNFNMAADDRTMGFSFFRLFVLVLLLIQVGASADYEGSYSTTDEPELTPSTFTTTDLSMLGNIKVYNATGSFAIEGSYSDELSNSNSQEYAMLETKATESIEKSLEHVQEFIFSVRINKFGPGSIRIYFSIFFTHMTPDSVVNQASLRTMLSNLAGLPLIADSISIVVEGPVTVGPVYVATDKPIYMLRIVDVTIYNATVLWTIPADHMGDVVSYQVLYYTEMNPDDVEIKRLPPSTTEFTVKDLQPATGYQIEVQAVLSNGLFQFGTLSFTTLNFVFVTAVSETTIRVEWYEDEKYDHYLVFYQPEDNPELEAVILVRKPTTEALIEKLEPDTTYLITVKAQTGQTSVELGSTSADTRAKRSPPIVGAVVGVLVVAILIVVIVIIVLWLKKRRNSQQNTNNDIVDEEELYDMIGNESVPSPATRARGPLPPIKVETGEEYQDLDNKTRDLDSHTYQGYSQPEADVTNDEYEEYQDDKEKPKDRESHEYQGCVIGNEYTGEPTANDPNPVDTDDKELENENPSERPTSGIKYENIKIAPK